METIVLSSVLFSMSSFIIRFCLRRLFYRCFFNMFGTILLVGIIGLGTYFYWNGDFRIWKQTDGNWYCYEPIINTPVTGWFNYEGQKYCADSKGLMLTGWQKVDKKWYYLYNDGHLARNTIIDGYYMDSDGSWESSD